MNSIKKIIKNLSNIWLLGRLVKIIEAVYRLPEIREEIKTVHQDLISHSLAIMEMQNRINEDFVKLQQKNESTIDFEKFANSQLPTLTNNILNISRDVQNIKFKLDGN